MEKKSDPFLLHIWDAIQQIETYIENYSFEEFETDRKIQDAVISQFEIIGGHLPN